MTTTEDPNAESSQENPAKASRPIVPTREAEPSFSLDFYVCISPPTLEVKWSVRDRVARDTFFIHHPVAAAMLDALILGNAASAGFSKQRTADGKGGNDEG